MAVRIDRVAQQSISYKKGIRKGDVLISINGNEITDVLDYRFYLTERQLKLVLKRDDSQYLALKIVKPEYEDIGLDFETYLMDQQHSCTNDCIFCFVDQMPEGMRETLYFKDDDARLSFLFGNYITLTNLKQSEIDRIIKMKISPINISVHTTNPQLRCEMMHNRFAGDKLAYIKQLADAQIAVNCQLVLCPGINDGEELRRTMGDLGKLYPSVQSIACVPVGLTKYRDGLYPLVPYEKETAREVIQIIDEFAEDFYDDHGTRLCFASDEFYIKAELPLPECEFYEDFVQLENGVGTITSLRQEFYDAVDAEQADGRGGSFSLATGVDVYPYIQELVDAAQKKWHNLKCKVYAVRNDFFGETITVAGLLTAQDIIAQLDGQELGETLILPNCMLRHEQDKFLDDLTVQDIEQKLGIPIQVIPTDGDALLNALLEE